MFVFLLFGWWYSDGWRWLASKIGSKYRLINEALSVGTLLRTFFAPWKQIQSTATLQNFIQTTVDNIISRFIGAAVRSVMIFTALILFIILSLVLIFVLLLWPILPLMIVILPILTIKGISL